MRWIALTLAVETLSCSGRRPCDINLVHGEYRVTEAVDPAILNASVTLSEDDAGTWMTVAYERDGETYTVIYKVVLQ